MDRLTTTFGWLHAGKIGGVMSVEEGEHCANADVLPAGDVCAVCGETRANEEDEEKEEEPRRMGR